MNLIPYITARNLIKTKIYIFILYMASLGFIAPPKFRSPLDTKAPSPPLIYLVGPLAISDPNINICVGPPNTYVALKQFNLLPLTHCFEAISFITP